VPREAARPARPLVDELTALLAERLPPHQRPRRITVVPELPRTATGKLQRFLLRERGGAS
jgi:acyl-coenzyme A synthetase/AMP-(fatty) acid ligase